MEHLIYPKLKLEKDRLPDLLEAVAAHASGVCGALEAGPVAVSPSRLPLSEFSAAGVGAEAALALFATSIAPSLTASAGPRHLGFVTGGATPAALIGDWLASLYDQNPVSKLDGSAALQIVRDTVTMLRDLFGLPSEFDSALVSALVRGRSFCGAATASDRRRSQVASKANLFGVSNDLLEYQN